MYWTKQVKEIHNNEEQGTVLREQMQGKAYFCIPPFFQS